MPLPIADNDFVFPGGAVEPGEAAAWDDEDELRRYSELREQAGGMRVDSHFVLSGLHCASCASVIERALRRVSGVDAASVNAARRRATVTWDPQRTKPSELVAAVRGAGYQAYPDMMVAEQEQQRLESRRTLWRLGVAVFCMMQVMMYATPSYSTSASVMGANISRVLQWASWLLCLPVLIFSAGPFYTQAWRALRLGRIGMDVPVVLGIWVAFAASTAVTLDPNGPWGHEVYFDSVTMLVSFLLAGRWLEGRVRVQAERSLEGVLYRLPQSVERLDAQGQVRWVPVSRLRPADRVRVAVGQAFAGDGVIVEGATEVDESLLTGESRLLSRARGDAVLAGSLNHGAPVTVAIERVGGQTRYERVVALMRQAVNERPPLVRAADRLAGPFLAAVLAVAAASAAVWWRFDPARAVGVAVAVLIVTCPCALSLAVPSALIAAASALARRQVLVQRLEALETLAHADTVCFDKTGTLTEHRLSLQSVHVDASARGSTQALPVGAQDYVRRAASLASHSLHPLSRALVHAGGHLGTADVALWHDVQETPGAGLSGVDAQGRRWRLGSAVWAGAGPTGQDEAHVWLCEEGGVRVAFVFDEALRADAGEAVKRLRRRGLSLQLLSGDQPSRVGAVAARLGLDRWRAAATPQDKLDAVRLAQDDGHRVVVVGDGINDAPVLARADVSFAMGHGAALAQARADFVVMNSHPLEVAATHDLACRTSRVIRQNLAWAAVYNAAAVPAAVLGWLPPWLAGLGMACSSLFVVLNATRLGWPDQGLSSSALLARAAGRGARAATQAS